MINSALQLLYMIVNLKRETSLVQLHVSDPVIYLRIGNEVTPPGGSAPITVDTHGATGQAETTPVGGSPDSRYVIVRTDIRTPTHASSTASASMHSGTGRRQEDVTETTTRASPRRPLDEDHSAAAAQLRRVCVDGGTLQPRGKPGAVWDFGVHPTAPDNRDALKLQAKRPYSFGRRSPN